MKEYVIEEEKDELDFFRLFDSVSDLFTTQIKLKDVDLRKYHLSFANVDRNQHMMDFVFERNEDVKNAPETISISITKK